MRSDAKKAPILDDDNGAVVMSHLHSIFTACPEWEFVAHNKGLALFMWACYLFYAGKHSATKKAESALEELQVLYRTQDSEDSEVKRDDPKETSKPLSMLDLFKANPQPQSESFDWIKRNSAQLVAKHEEACKLALHALC